MPQEVTAADLLHLLGARERPPWLTHTMTPQEAWGVCRSGADLVWVALRLGVERSVVVAALCALVRESSEWSSMLANGRRCIEVVEAWCRGEATLKLVKAAADAADRMSRVHLAGGESCSITRAAAEVAYAAWLKEYPEESARVSAALAGFLKEGAFIVRARIPWALLEARIAEVKP